MTTPPRLIDIIAAHIRASRSGNTYVEINEQEQTILVDGITVGSVAEQTITIRRCYSYTVFQTSTDDLTLDARDPSFLTKLDYALFDKIDDSSTISQRRAYRENREMEWRQNLIKSFKK